MCRSNGSSVLRPLLSIQMAHSRRWLLDPRNAKRSHLVGTRWRQLEQLADLAVVREMLDTRKLAVDHFVSICPTPPTAIINPSSVYIPPNSTASNPF